MSESLREGVQMQAPLEEPLVSSRPSSHSDAIPADFSSQVLWGHPFPALVPWAREPGVGLGSIASAAKITS